MTAHKTELPQKKSLQAVVGSLCAAVLCAYVPDFEGVVLRGYKDPIGIVTACAGHTKTAVLGKPYTMEECLNLLQIDLIEHAEGVLRCAPILEGRTWQLAASVSFAYNVGVGAFCGSTMARKFNAGDFEGACAELDRWVYANGKVLSGLVKRRRIERDLCEMHL